MSDGIIYVTQRNDLQFYVWAVDWAVTRHPRHAGEITVMRSQECELKVPRHDFELFHFTFVSQLDRGFGDAYAGMNKAVGSTVFSSC